MDWPYSWLGATARQGEPKSTADTGGARSLGFTAYALAAGGLIPSLLPLLYFIVLIVLLQPQELGRLFHDVLAVARTWVVVGAVLLGLLWSRNALHSEDWFGALVVLLFAVTLLMFDASATAMGWTYDLMLGTRRVAPPFTAVRTVRTRAREIVVSAAPLDPAGDARRLESLARIVAEDVAADLRRAADRATNEARRVTLEAEDRLAELERAAKELGTRRGAAVESAAERAGEREAAEVAATAFDALAERFVARLRLALNALPGTSRHAAALRTWAAEAVARMDRPADVFVESVNRPALYDALLIAGARDFRIHADPRVHVGFVVRDLDGRTLLDRRPEALLAERRADLLALLRSRLPSAPA